MKITLITPYSDIFCMGVRSLSACLRKAGHKTRLIFLPKGTFEVKEAPDFSYVYSENILRDVVDLCRDSDLIGISLMTNYFTRVDHLTQRLKSELDIPIAWGGVHATVRPDECIKYADMVCIGEGEDALLELVSKMEAGQDYFDTQNFWFNRNGEIIVNGIRPLIQNLDTIPFPDYDLDEHYVLEKARVLPLDKPLLKDFLQRGHRYFKKGGLVVYPTMATRGCPHNCAYCCNNALRRLYDGQRYLRRRSNENVIEELLQVKNQFDFINTIDFEDDSFFAASTAEIKKFSQLYKEHINLPFFCYCSPVTINEEKMEHIVHAGLLRVLMGIQTGSERTQRLYSRNIPNQRVEAAAKIINKFKFQTMAPSYDVIIDNPYETDEDLLETLHLLLKLPKPYNLRIFSLTFYPGTELYDKVKKDNIIADDIKQIYQKHYFQYQGNYLNFILYLVANNLPNKILRFLLSKKMLWLLNRKKLTNLYSILYRLSKPARIVIKIIKSILFWKKGRLKLKKSYADSDRK